MSPSLKLFYRHNERFPRVSGDEPCWGWMGTWSAMFSPRERG